MHKVTAGLRAGFLSLALLLGASGVAQTAVVPDAPALIGAAIPASNVTLPLLDAFPLLGLLLASALVLLAAAIVQPATEWFKIRLKHRMGDVPHWMTHTISLLLSLAVGLLFMGDGRLAADPVFTDIAWPLNVLIFSGAVFLRAGGWFDLQRDR